MRAITWAFTWARGDYVDVYEGDYVDIYVGVYVGEGEVEPSMNSGDSRGDEISG